MSEPKVWRFFTNEGDYADLDGSAACEHLGRVLSFPTVSNMDNSLVDWDVFEAQQAYMRKAYPHVFGAGTVELVDHSLLITIPGSDASLKPVMFMGHQDVVSVVPGTEEDWSQGAFSGAVDETYIWGRGAIDMKDQVVGELEAVEYALAHGWQLRRTLILAFGQDEETTQLGAKQLAETLAERGVQLEFLVDEGDYRIVDGGEYGAPGTWLMHADLLEKGYADIRLTVRSAGGHSSNPFGGTSLETLARALVRVCDIEWPVRLTPATKAMLESLAPYISAGPLYELGVRSAADVEARADEIAQACLSDRKLFPLVTTTCAPDVIEGSSTSFNVMPQDMSAVVNFRMLQGVGVADVLARCQEAVADLPVELELGSGGSEATAAGEPDSLGMQLVKAAAARYFASPDERKLLVVSGTQVGATDAANYAGICPACIRFSAFVVDDEEAGRGVHGTNERISKRAYLQGIRFFIRLIEDACL